MATPGWRHPERLCKPPFPIQVGDALCHPKSPAAIGFLTNTSQVNRTVLIWIISLFDMFGIARNAMLCLNPSLDFHLMPRG